MRIDVSVVVNNKSISGEMLKSVIDPEKLIEEVQKRPPIYDSNDKFQRPEVRKACWENIAREMFVKIWSTCAENEREALIREVQGKWQVIRDTYDRCKKLHDKLEPEKFQRRKYVFFDQLRFLDQTTPGEVRPMPVLRTPTTITRKYTAPTKPTVINSGAQSKVSINVEDPNNVLVKESENSAMVVDQAPSTYKLVSASTPAAPSTLAAGNKIALALNELVELQKQNKKDDRMGNRSFLLSLLPFFEKLPDDVNMELRLQVMSIIQTYSHGESLMKPSDVSKT